MRLEPVGSTTWRMRPAAIAPAVEPVESTSLLFPRSGPQEQPGTAGHRRRHGPAPDHGAPHPGTVPAPGTWHEVDVRDVQPLPIGAADQLEVLLRAARADVTATHPSGRHGTRLTIDLTEQHPTIDLRA